VSVLNRLTTPLLRVLASGFPPARDYTGILPPKPEGVPHTEPATARANGIQFAYGTFGDPSAAPLLLVMGLAAQMVAWDDEFCVRLAARGFWVIRFDNRDIGGSTKLDEAGVPNLLALNTAKWRGRPRRAPYTLRDMADDAIGLLDTLGIASAHVVGISMGGMIAQLMSIYHPERVRTLTSIMSDTGKPDLPRPDWKTVAALLLPSPKERESYQERSLLTWRIIGGRQTPIDGERTRERAGRAFDRGLSSAGVIRQMAAILAAEPRAEALRSVAAPTLVIHGDADRLVPIEGGQHTAAVIPGAQLMVIAGMGHALPPPFWIPVIDGITRHAERKPTSERNPHPNP
jgi:pimeloyl-ACP methyl ester carboxylesterase